MTEEDFQELLDQESHNYIEKQKELQEEKRIKRKNELRSSLLLSNSIEEIEEIEKCI
jgi:hypothetical protein